MTKKATIVLTRNDVETFLKIMDKKYVKRVGYSALRYAAYPIIKRTKSAYKLYSKGYGKTNALYKSFKVKKSKKEISVYVGSTYYKARWLEGGTKERYTKKNYYRGRIKASNFLEKAAIASKSEVVERINKKLAENIQKLIKKIVSNA